MKSNKGPSIFAEDVLVIGAISSDSQVEIFGRVEGDVRAGSLTIGKDAYVKGEVVAESVVVRGRVEGLVRARNVQLVSTASVQGDIIQATLAVQNGAVFNGHCRQEADISHSDAVDKTANDSIDFEMRWRPTFF
jgi:cytoskeletal protein CcmA (bactofilin family)